MPKNEGNWRRAHGREVKWKENTNPRIERKKGPRAVGEREKGNKRARRNIESLQTC